MALGCTVEAMHGTKHAQHAGLTAELERAKVQNEPMVWREFGRLHPNTVLASSMAMLMPCLEAHATSVVWTMLGSRYILEGAGEKTLCKL